MLHEVGLYDLAIAVDDIHPDVKGRHVHELRNIQGGGGYTGLYGWFGKAATPASSSATSTTKGRREA